MSKSKGIFLDKNLLRSEAFRSLDKWSLLVYLDFLRKRKMSEVKRSKRSSVWIIENNGEIVYPYSEAEHKGIGRGSFRTAIDKLIAHGFLDITHQGTGGRKGDVTTYKIDDRWQKYGTQDFRPAKNPRKKDTRQGRGWASIMSDPKKKKAILKKRQRIKEKKKSSVLKTTPEKSTLGVEINTPNNKKQKVSSVVINTPINQKEAADACDSRESAQTP